MIQTAGSVTMGGETINFGEVIHTREAFVAFPPGTVVDWQQTGQMWTKLADGQWQQDGRTTPSGANDQSMSLGFNHLVSMPVDRIVIDGIMFPVIGGLMSRDQLNASPIGTVIQDPVTREHLTKEEAAWTYGGFNINPDQNYNTLVSVPGFELVPEVPAAPFGWVMPSMTLPATNTGISWNDMTVAGTAISAAATRMRSPLRRGATLDRLKQNLGLGAVAMAIEYSKPLAPVYAALTELGITLRPVTNQMFPTSAFPLPEGTVVTHGEEGDSDFSMWLMKGTLVQVLGSTPVENLPYVKVAEAPAFDRPARADNEEELIAAWRREVWDKGWQFKTENDWCSAYETLLRDHGITAESVGAPAPVHEGPFANFPTGEWAEVRELPEGTIVARVGEGGEWRIVQKGHAEDGRVAWRRLVGSTGYHVLRTHILWHGGQGALAINNPGVEFLDALPAGSRAQHVADFTWTKGEDNRWYHRTPRNDGSGATADQFRSPTVIQIGMNDNNLRSAA